MKRTMRTLAATTGIVTVLAGTLVTAGTAAAEDAATTNQPGIRIVAQAHTDEGGWIEYAIDDLADGVTIQAVEEVGGGIWSHGATANAAGQKSCYSQYRHDSVAHGSSVEMDGSKDSDWVGPGAVSSARVTKYTTATCKTYWRK
ncbi:hypothetical protein SZMC14600_09398 [Saccharomonospora azurea SZMC 14600]|uniref:lactococcin 972 family bacteriocin n=1 Tax=Saccharomonospora azurea TaxID=40988 RepID=UPI00023FFE6E|nr:lactococcin 972 family bacteriocin [Saccharomonospora azurea]EHK87527.1 hypothetical protein SZMC14600_09398 [Saccharomonospora azurea SZMC 14600]